MIATYTVQGNLPGATASATKDFYVPTFGMSCYYLALQSEWGEAPNACGTTTIKHKPYFGSVTNPYGLNGTYCDAFIHQVILQGSGQLTSGQYIHYNSDSNTISLVNAVTGSDNTPVVANQTVARDKAIIPAKGVRIDLDQIGFGLLANDTGGDIQQYRLDLFKGFGKKVCIGYPNPMAVGACSPAQSLCPASAIQ
jgi:3D (Asp-Asp-Asp) domain-containing protein